MSENHDSLPPKSIDAVALASVGRLEGSQRAFQTRVTRVLLAITFVLACIVGTGLVLRLAVSTLGRSKVNTVEIEGVRPVSRSSSDKLSRREHINEQLREQARLYDKRLLERRRDRAWVYETRELPDAQDAKQIWQREVKSIEKQLADAKSLQERVDAEAPEEAFEAIAEGSVLWHRMKYLEELREDAPKDE